MAQCQHLLPILNMHLVISKKMHRKYPKKFHIEKTFLHLVDQCLS